MKIRKVALIVFYDLQKRILLQSRSGISKTGAEWGFFGGAIEKGESSEQALVRETKEELLFDLEEYKFLGEFKNQINDELLVDRFVFISSIKGNLSKLKQVEGDKMQFFSLEEAEKLKMVPGDELVIQKLKEIL